MNEEKVNYRLNSNTDKHKENNLLMYNNNNNNNMEKPFIDSNVNRQYKKVNNEKLDK